MWRDLGAVGGPIRYGLQAHRRVDTPWNLTNPYPTALWVPLAGLRLGEKTPNNKPHCLVGVLGWTKATGAHLDPKLHGVHVLGEDPNVRVIRQNTAASHCSSRLGALSLPLD